MNEAHPDAAPASADTASFQKAGSLRALRSGGNVCVSLEGKRVALFAVGDAVIATEGRCPHAKGPLHEGSITAETLTCPWHGYTFSLQTGTCDDDPDLLLARYDVRIDDDDIYVRC